MAAERELLPLSALQHLLFCERQCALIHIEGLWAENKLTVEGQHLHQKAHAGHGESRPGVRIARGLAIQSERLGLVGYADVVEFHEDANTGATRPFPVEYKRGRPKRHDADLVQLCAQAMCLEETFNTTVAAGALFYGSTRRRLDVTFDQRLRQLTWESAARLHEMIASGVTPRARRERKCEQCSMFHLCMPDALDGDRRASRYLRNSIRRSLTEPAPEPPDS